MKKIFGGLFVLICALSLFACDFSTPEQFGYFTHNGYALTSFGTKSLSFTEAYTLIQSNSMFNNTKTNLLSSSDTLPQLSTDQMDEVMRVYSSVEITTKYWDGTEQFTKKNVVFLTTTIQGTEKIYPEILRNNQNTVATGMVINNMILTEDLLEYYEKINNDFKASSDYLNAPFLDMYSYGANENYGGDFVLEINDYSYNSSSITGTSTMEIHGSEAMYDDNNLISYYQTSFGFMYQTPGGTSDVGTVLEVSFDWIKKE